MRLVLKFMVNLIVDLLADIFAMFFDWPTGRAWALLTAIALNALYPDVI